MPSLSNLSHISPFKFMVYFSFIYIYRNIYIHIYVYIFTEIYYIYIYCNKLSPFRVAWMIYLFIYS